MKENKRSFILRLGAIILILTIALGSLLFFIIRTGKITKELENEEYEEYQDYYAMIVDDRTSEFWQSVYEGARKEGQENDIYVELLGSNLSEKYSREELMKIAILSKVDGIIVEADESQAMTELIEAAAAQGITVITVLGDNTAGERQSFVGVGSYNLGRVYGRQVIKLCRGATKTVLILMSGNADGTSQNVLFSGIQETIEREMPADGKAYLEVKTVDNQRTFSAEETIRDIFINGEQLPDIIICLDEISTSCVYQAVVDYNKVGQIDIIGYYASPSILQAIERKVVYSTIAINTAQMGRFCVDALKEYNDLGNVSEYFSVDVTLINSGNVQKYIGGAGDD